MSATRPLPLEGEVHVGERYRLTTVDGPMVIEVTALGPPRVGGARQYAHLGRRVFSRRIDEGPQPPESARLFEVDLLTSPNAERVP